MCSLGAVHSHTRSTESVCPSITRSHLSVLYGARQMRTVLSTATAGNCRAVKCHTGNTKPCVLQVCACTRPSARSTRALYDHHCPWRVCIIERSNDARKFHENSVINQSTISNVTINIRSAVHCRTPHYMGMSIEHVHAFARRHIPHARRPVEAAGDHHWQFGTVHDTIYLTQCAPFIFRVVHASLSEFDQLQLSMFDAGQRVFIGHDHRRYLSSSKIHDLLHVLWNAATVIKIQFLNRNRTHCDLVSEC